MDLSAAGFGSTLTGVLPELRVMAESRMGSVVTVRRPSGDTTPDADGYEVPEWDDVLVDSPFRLGGSQDGSSGTRRVTIGDVETQQALRTGHFPAGTTDLRDGDLIDITSGENAGLVLQIIEADAQDQATAYRVPVISVQRPEEWA